MAGSYSGKDINEVTSVISMGGESLCAAQSVVITKWFKGRELALALGMALTISNVGSTFNGFIIPPVYNSGEG